MKAAKPYDPPKNAVRLEKRPKGEGWVCVGAGVARAWLNVKTMRYVDVEGPDRWGAQSSQISLWMSSQRFPTAAQRAQIERFTEGAIPAECWLWWIGPTGGAAAQSATIPTVQPLGNTLVAMRASAERMLAILANQSLPPKTRADLEGKLSIALGRIAAREEAIALEDHPEFERFLDLILGALDATLQRYGVDPQGARNKFAEELERLEREADRVSEAA